ncbi:MAG TPA: ABC transporter ATP-binding protein [Burkholderiaceae bacterium]|nr:ABC transporter ATP-binding protein [Burkholderiaceae bacterium]
MTKVLLACRGLDVRYGERWLVRCLHIEIAEGERWALVGPNGAGKTTLLQVLAGVRAADAGAVELAGRPLDRWSVEELAAQRALVADRWFDPFGTRAIDTVMAARYRFRGAKRATSGNGQDGERLARQCLAAMDCEALALRDVRQLSRGERQRVALAAGLAQQSALILLDEPISHQDPRHQVQVLQQLSQRKQCTYVGALHDINAAARFATHALLLTGDGSWQAGASHSVLTQEHLSPLFGTEIVQVLVDSHRVFVSTGGVPA